MSLSLDYTLCQLNPLQIFPVCSFKIYFNIFHSSTPWLSCWYLPSLLSQPNVLGTTQRKDISFSSSSLPFHLFLNLLFHVSPIAFFLIMFFLIIPVLSFYLPTTFFLNLILGCLHPVACVRSRRERFPSMQR
jgi:polyferredoxin